MDLTDILRLLTPLDGVSVGLIFVGAVAMGTWIEHPGGVRPSVTMMMERYRRDWMVEFLGREVRIFDAQMLASLRQGTAFFASTCLLAIGGTLAMIGNVGTLQGVAEGLLGSDVPVLLWQVKLMLPALFLVHGFLKFVWSNRLFGYCAVMMAAVPNDPTAPHAARRAAQAAELNNRASMNFNRGLRAMYFALGALAWLVGPVALFGATLAVLWLVWSREFASKARSILTEGET